MNEIEWKRGWFIFPYILINTIYASISYMFFMGSILIFFFLLMYGVFLGHLVGTGTLLIMSIIYILIVILPIAGLYLISMTNLIIGSLGFGDINRKLMFRATPVTMVISSICLFLWNPLFDFGFEYHWSFSKPMFIFLSFTIPLQLLYLILFLILVKNKGKNCDDNGNIIEDGEPK